MWTNVPGADHYEIQWKSGDSGFSTPITVNKSAGTNSNYNDTSLTSSTKYIYRVRAVNVNGPGDWSGEASGTTLSTQAAAGQMPKVTGLAVEDKTESNTGDARVAKLTWNAVSNATHYDLQRYDSSTTAGWGVLGASGEGISEVAGATRITKTKAGSSPSFTDTFGSVAAGKTYYYVVSAVEDGVDNTAGNADDEMGEWSDHKSVTFKAHKPNVPTGLAAEKTSGTSILVSWSAPSTDDETVNNVAQKRGAATAYTLEWKTANSTARYTVDVTGTSYHHTGLQGTTAYSYRVKARNTGGESEYTAADSVTLGNTLSPPGGLKAVDATTGTGDTTSYQIKVSWSAVTGASRYEIQRFDTDDNMWGDINGTAGQDDDVLSGTSYTHTLGTGTANANQTRLYRVRTVKEEDAKSGWSASVSGTTKAATPSAPTLVATSTGMSMIRLTWNSVAGATGYEIEFLKGSYPSTDAFGAANLNRSKITVSGGSHRNYVHTGRTTGTRYSYRIRAKLAQGGETGWSTPPVRQYTKPAQPDLSATTAVSNTMTLKWDAVKFWTAPDDPAVGEEGHLTASGNYQVQRERGRHRRLGTCERQRIVRHHHQQVYAHRHRSFCGNVVLLPDPCNGDPQQHHLQQLLGHDKTEDDQVAEGTRLDLVLPAFRM